MAHSSGASDEALLGAFLSGDRLAFSELVRRHEDRIFSLGVRMLGNRADALDATQETFLTVFRKARTFREEAAFGTWIYRIGINSCHDLLRARARRREAEEPEDPAPSASATDLDDAVAARIDLSRALSELPPEYREAVLMHDLGGIPYEQISELTGAAMGTVKSRISRGRRRLAELLEQAPGREPSKDRI